MATKSKPLLEKDYYPIVAKWLSKQHDCFLTEINTGPINSRADVVGVKDTGGDYSGEIETIVIEVKRDKEPFATASGQTFGYTIYANRVYLADKRENGFTSDEIMIANHIGIGLIQIDKNNRCQEVLTSPYYKPVTKFNIQFLNKLGLGKCQFCDTFFSLGNKNNHNANVTRENIKKAVSEERGLIFWHRELDARKIKFKSDKRNKEHTYERRYLCPECTMILFQNNNTQ
jgi:hypothetical protein